MCLIATQVKKWNIPLIHGYHITLTQNITITAINHLVPNTVKWTLVTLRIHWLHSGIAERGMWGHKNWKIALWRQVISLNIAAKIGQALLCYHLSQQTFSAAFILPFVTLMLKVQLPFLNQTLVVQPRNVMALSFMAFLSLTGSRSFSWNDQVILHDVLSPDSRHSLSSVLLCTGIHPVTGYWVRFPPLLSVWNFISFTLSVPSG